MVTPLMVIQAQMDLIRAEDGVTPAILRCVSFAEASAARWMETVRGFLDFIRKHRGVREVINLKPVVEHTAELRASHWASEGIVVDLKLDPSPRAIASGPEIQQALMNIIRNAEDAIAANGSEKRIAIRLPECGRRHCGEWQ
jgi:signal transduction histidine kinase